MIRAGIIESSDKWDISEVPEIPLAQYLLETVRNNLPKCGPQPWVIDPLFGTSVKFNEIEDKSRRIASFLKKLGFRRGHVLFFVTYESAQIHLVQLAVWRLGGAVRGSYQEDKPDEFAKQMSESHVEFVLVDVNTASKVQEAVSLLEWPVHMLAVGYTKVENVINFEDMILEEGEARPDEVNVNVHEDTVIIPNTSGSTGFPKGVLLSHYNCVASLFPRRSLTGNEAMIMTPMSNYAVGIYNVTMTCLQKGITAVHLGRFDPNTYFKNLKKFKPGSLLMYPYIASWFIRSPEVDKEDLSFLKYIALGGAVIDPNTTKMFAARFPKVLLNQLYGMTESLMISATDLSHRSFGSLPMIENQGELYVSSGEPMPYMQIKVVDLKTRKILEPGERGEILIKSPTVMQGYLRKDAPPDRSKVDAEGWLQSGDLGFYDEFGHIYIVERLNLIFKYYMHFVTPSEIEAVLKEYDAVHCAGVIGVPNAETTHLTRAYVVLRPGREATTADELQAYVADRLPEHMQLHGGIRFLNKLPQNRGGKLDRIRLKELAMNEQ